uniref:CD4-1 molecule isoform X2 n=1 Tax=Solea senegalensis TaxID=28829 RepID=UPI001CD8BA37|nr:CD4-1 molecule isoform X2 [Solea senegalensis]
MCVCERERERVRHLQCMQHTKCQSRTHRCPEYITYQSVAREVQQLLKRFCLINSQHFLFTPDPNTDGHSGAQRQTLQTRMGNFLQPVIILFSLLVSTTGAVQVVYAQVGETVNLKPLELKKSHNYVYWTFMDLQLGWRNHFGGKSLTNDKAWNNKLQMTDDSLIIQDIQQENFGTFQVSVSSQSPLISTISTIILVKLEVSKSPASPLLPGESLSLHCSAEVSQKPEIYWLDPTGQRKTNNDGSFSTRVTGQHNGEWTCVVAQQKHVKMSITVVDLSPAPSHAQYTSTSMPVTIPCSLSPHITWEQIKVKGVEEVHWQFFPRQSSGVSAVKAQRLFFLSLESMLFTAERNRDLRPVLRPTTGNFTLTRKQGREEDAGDYVCTVKFKNGVTLNSTVRVDVLQIMAYPGADLHPGQLLNLTCSIGHPLPSDLRLQWSPPKHSPQESVHHSAHLTIPEVSTGDAGNWGCSLWEGKRRLTSTVITLSIEHRLNVWMLVIICGAAVIVILLVILIVILYRRRNRKMRHLRHQLCRCKHPKPKGFYRT